MLLLSKDGSDHGRLGESPVIETAGLTPSAKQIISGQAMREPMGGRARSADYRQARQVYASRNSRWMPRQSEGGDPPQVAVAELMPEELATRLAASGVPFYSTASRPLARDSRDLPMGRSRAWE